MEASTLAPPVATAPVAAPPLAAGQTGTEAPPAAAPEPVTAGKADAQPQERLVQKLVKFEGDETEYFVKVAVVVVPPRSTKEAVVKMALTIAPEHRLAPGETATFYVGAPLIEVPANKPAEPEMQIG